MWSYQDDVILSAASYYIDSKLNKTSLHYPKTYGDPPLFQMSEGDAFSKNCGQVFITINHLLVFHCTFCDNKYGTLFNFLQHITAKHLRTNRSEKSEITSKKEIGITNKKTSIVELKPVQKHLSLLIDNIEATTEKKLSSNERTKKKHLRQKKSAKQKNKKETAQLETENEVVSIKREINYDTKETLIAESRPEHELLSPEVILKTGVNKEQSLNKRRKKTYVEIKETAGQAVKKDVEAAKLRETTENESTDFKSEEHQQDKISICSLEDQETTTNLKNSNKPLGYKCDKCDKVFAKKGVLSYHILIHSNVKDHKCTICDSSFTLKSNLKQHLMRHTNVKDFSCDLCDKRFFSNTEVAIHKRMHTGERPYVCFKCGNSFKTSSGLSIHMKRHNNIRSKKCDICEKTFVNGFSLRNHMAGHSTDRPFVCSYCSVSFTRKRTLQQHIKLHINAREYKCNLCEKSFNQKPALLSHMNHTHKLLEYHKSI